MMPIIMVDVLTLVGDGFVRRKTPVGIGVEGDVTRDDF